MKGFFAGFAPVLALSTGLLVPVSKAAAQQRYTQPAQQCVQRRDYAAGTNGVPYPFSRFYNTCNVAITLLITTPENGNNGPGATGPGTFMVMNWTDGTPKPTQTFACVWAGEPVTPGSTFVNPTSYGASSFQCLVP